jgi:hypothetical protein
MFSVSSLGKQLTSIVLILLSLKLACCKYGRTSSLTFVILLKSTFKVSKCVRTFNDDISFKLLFDRSI